MNFFKKVGIMLCLISTSLSLNSCFFGPRNERAGYYTFFDKYEYYNIYRFLDWDDSDATSRYVLFNDEDFDYKIVDEKDINEYNIQSRYTKTYSCTDFIYDTGVFKSSDSIFPEFVTKSILDIYDQYRYNTEDESRYFESHIVFKENQYLGYLNIYKQTGRLTRGHGLHVEDLYQSIYFTISGDNHSIIIHHVFQDYAIVAFYQDFVMYYDNKKYYSYNIHNQEKVFLMDDIGMNHGISSQSNTFVYFYEDKVLLQMNYSPTLGYPKTQIWLTSFDGKNKVKVFDDYS